MGFNSAFKGLIKCAKKMNVISLRNGPFIWLGCNNDSALDVPGSVHRSINHLEKTNKMRPCSRMYNSNVSNCSTCFERHIAHHQELKTISAAAGFYIRLWLPAAVVAHSAMTQTYLKPEAADTVFEFLMMKNDVSLETC